MKNLIDWVKDNGLTSEDLDEIVHDIFSRKASDVNNSLTSHNFDEIVHDVFSQKASDINNGGIEKQLNFLKSCFGNDQQVEVELRTLL